MSERATVFEDTILGMEVVPGTSVAVTKRMTAMGIAATPDVTTRRFRPRGRKLDTLVIPGKRMTNAEIEGAGTFHDPVYALSSIFGKPTPILVPTATAVWDWTFVTLPAAPDVPQTFTVESGSTVRAAKFTHGLFTEYGMEMNSDEVNVSGAMIGQVYTDGVAKTTVGVTATGDTPIIPDDTDVFLDTTFGAIGTTKLLRALGANWNIASKYNPLWVMNSANPSWVAPVETPPDLTLTMTLEADAAGMAILTALETGVTRWVKIFNQGPIIESTFRYEFEVLMAARVEAVNSLGDNDGVYAVEWGFRAVDTSDIAGAKIRIRTNFNTL